MCEDWLVERAETSDQAADHWRAWHDQLADPIWQDALPPAWEDISNGFVATLNRRLSVMITALTAAPGDDVDDAPPGWDDATLLAGMEASMRA